uniref:Olfactory receptor n=1 Tax=Pyxicephalus adspersus TaxID=30357 RepID=A0AAV3ARV7_PYXAD|nr:TPA: hypothetical protein GDO54_009950 [Pyxicephalus adspersus]
MPTGNQSTITEFILLGLSADPLLQVILFPIFLAVYMTTLTGNLLLLMTVRIDKRLHTSMYFFLVNLSVLDIGYSSVIVPKMLANFFLTRKMITFSGCAMQVFFHLLVGETECTLLSLMAYERYVAICIPLRYNMIMNTRVCFWMISMSWVAGCIQASADTYFVFSLTYCGPNTLNHFFCEGPMVMQLSCTDILLTNIIKLVGTATVLFIPLSFILISYIQIVVTISKLHSGKSKAFSSCVSHVVVVVIFYGAPLYMYVRPEHTDTGNTDKMLSVFYAVITPMLNPLIYSLRNKDVQRAIRIMVGRH